MILYIHTTTITTSVFISIAFYCNNLLLSFPPAPSLPPPHTHYNMYIYIYSIIKHTTSTSIYITITSITIIIYHISYIMIILLLQFWLHPLPLHLLQPLETLRLKHVSHLWGMR